MHCKPNQSPQTPEIAAFSQKSGHDPDTKAHTPDDGKTEHVRLAPRIGRAACALHSDEQYPKR
jgi:hypothetical protein